MYIKKRISFNVKDIKAIILAELFNNTFFSKEIMYNKLKNEIEKEELFYCANLCKRSYSHKLDSFDFYENSITETELYIQKEKNKATIVFRGTDEKEDWGYNLKFKQTCFYGYNDNLKLHRGFFEKFTSVQSYLFDQLISFDQSTDNTFIVTGHSLGGALSTVCALAIKMKFPFATVKCVTFGAPRVGNRKFVNTFDTRIDAFARVVNENDPACAVPPPVFYRHTCNSVHIGKKSKWKTLWAMITNSVDCLDNTSFDHSISNYIKNLK